MYLFMYLYCFLLHTKPQNRLKRVQFMFYGLLLKNIAKGQKKKPALGGLKIKHKTNNFITIISSAQVVVELSDQTWMPNISTTHQTWIRSPQQTNNRINPLVETGELRNNDCL